MATYTYDATGSLGLLASSSSYDTAGNAYTESVPTYDARNRPTSRQWTIPSAATGVSGTYKMAYTYDPADHVRSVQYPGGSGGTLGETVTTGYDSLGYPTTLMGSSTYVTASGYTTNGSLKSQTLGASAIARSLTYEPDTGRLATMKAGSGGSTTNRQNLTYGYDQVSNVTSITDGNNANQRQCFQYDQRNRLLRGFTGTDDCSTYDGSRGTNPAAYSQLFTYSPTGNFLTAAGRSYGYGTGTGTKPHAPLTVGSDSFAYNENGAELGRTVNGVGAIFGYDAQNRLTSIGQTSGTSTYMYGADGQRLVRKDGTTITLYLDGGNYQARSVNGATATVTTYYTLGSQRVAVRKGSTLNYELADQLGSASATTDSSGNNLVRQNYYPYGGLRPGPGNNLPVDETYLGKTLDAATSLVQMGARYYDPGIGRFISVDPLATPSAPQSLNPYSYSLNNPISNSDPSGLQSPGACSYQHNCAPGKGFEEPPGGGTSGSEDPSRTADEVGRYADSTNPSDRDPEAIASALKKPGVAKVLFGRGIVPLVETFVDPCTVGDMMMPCRRPTQGGYDYSDEVVNWLKGDIGPAALEALTIIEIYRLLAASTRPWFPQNVSPGSTDPRDVALAGRSIPGYGAASRDIVPES